jgi:prepilin-type N-terminal cleavage/methylation domain-containing protein
MKMLTKGMHRGEKGFTLIELLIVVAILGIIAAVVIPNISGFMITGQLAAANTEAEQVKTASLGYFADHGVWPDTSTDLPPNYISGTLRAVYEIDNESGCGWLVGASNSTWSASINFTNYQTGPTGHSGSWARS